MWTTGWSLLGTLIYFPFVSIAGAGYHSESKAKEYKHVCKRACQKVCVTCSTVLYWVHRKCLHLAAWALCVYWRKWGKTEQKQLRWCRDRTVHGHEVQQHSHQCWQIADTKWTVGEQEKVTVVPTRSVPPASCTSPGFLELSVLSVYWFLPRPLFGVYLNSSIQVALWMQEFL